MILIKGIKLTVIKNFIASGGKFIKLGEIFEITDVCFNEHGDELIVLENKTIVPQFVTINQLPNYFKLYVNLTFQLYA